MSSEIEKSGRQSPAPSSSAKGLREFFRKKHSGSNRALDSTGNDDGAGNISSVDSQDSNSLSVGSDSLSGSAYGNYLTVSGTGASILKDLFHKKYRAEVDQTTATTEERETKKKITFGQATIFSFRSKKEKSQDGGSASGEVESQSKSTGKGQKEGRSRHKSGPERASNVIGLDVDSKSKQGKVKTFLDSFRMHPKSDSRASDGPSADPNLQIKQLYTSEHDTQYKSVAGKVKKFHVTPAKRNMEIGPSEFVEMYRSRAFSDSQPQDLLAARAAARRHHLSGHSPTRAQASRNGFEFREDKRHIVVWRDKRKGTKIFQLPSVDAVNGIRDEFGDPNDADLAYTRFMKSHACYDLIPNSSKLVIFDTQLTVKKAFLALVQNGLRAAVLWDTVAQDFSGMLTVTDFIHILHKYYHSSQEHLNEVENNKIATWKEQLECRPRIVCIDAECNLLDVIRSLYNNKVHRLLIMDDFRGNPLNLLSHKRLLKFLYQHMRHLQKPLFMDKTLEELQVGTYENLVTLKTDAPLIEALKLFVERRISAIPVVDGEGQVVDLFAKIDIINLIHEKLYTNLDVSISEVLKTRREASPCVLTCTKSETLQIVVDQIVTYAMHRLIVVDEKKQPVGVVSLSDILNFLILLPAHNVESSAKLSDDQVESTKTTETDDTSNETEIDIGKDKFFESGATVGPKIVFNLTDACERGTDLKNEAIEA